MLYSIMQQHAAAELAAENVPGIVAAINAPTIEVRDDTLRTSRWVMVNLTDVIDQDTGATTADLVLGTLQKSDIPRVRAAYDAMSSGGIDLSDPQVQGMIGKLGEAAGWPEPLIAQIKVAGVRYESPAVNAGLGIVTEEQVQAALDDHAAQEKQRELEAAVAAINVEWVAVLNDGGINSALALADRAALSAALTAAAETFGV